MLSKYIVEKNCHRQRFSTNFAKNLKNFVECRSILAKNVVEKKMLSKKTVVEFYDSTPFSDGFFRQKILSKNEVKKCCRKKLI